MSAPQWTPHLEELGRAEVPGSGPILLEGDTAFVLHAFGYAVAAVDVSTPAQPGTRWTLPFKGQVFGYARLGRNLWIGESRRALNAVDVSDPAHPRYHDCLVLLGRQVGTVAAVGERLLVGCGSWGLVLVDPTGRRPLVAARLPFEDVEGFALDGTRVFVALGSGGLAVVELDGDRLVERARVLPPEEFYVRSAHLAGERVYCFGSQRKSQNDLVVLDRAEPWRELFRGVAGISAPRSLQQIGARAVGFHAHYSCSAFEEPGPARKLFEMYRAREDGRYVELGPGGYADFHCECADEVADYALRGGVLYAAQGTELVTYAVRPGSVFAG